MAASPSRSFTYRYSRLRWNDIEDDVPMATALLSWGEERIRAKLLMDTGATLTFLPKWMAEKLGMELQPHVHGAQTPAGTMSVQRSTVHLALADPTPEGRIGRAHLLDPVLIAEDTSLPFPILGRKPFLRWYRLSVDEGAREFTLAEKH